MVIPHQSHRLLMIAALICVVVAAAFPWVSRYLAVDSCLDAGGQWDYVAETCIAAAAAER